MNNKERFENFFNRKKIDRLPCIEWASWWHLTMDAWRNEGVEGTENGYTLKEKLGLDKDKQFWIPNLKHGFPTFKEHGIISNEEEYEKLKPYVFQKELIYDMKEQFEDTAKNVCEAGDITWFTLSGFFWFPRDLFGIEDHLYSFYDNSELYHKICEDMTEYYIFVIEEITKYFQPQFMTFGEDMSYNLGPMISEDMFNEFMKPYYERIIPVLKKKGIKVIVDSDGDITKLVPWLIGAGVEGILPLERQSSVDVNMLTEKYPDFFFIGGFDKLVMKNGEEAMRKEFERILPAIRRGNYIPSVDHQTPPDVSIENYNIYVNLLKEYVAMFTGS